jgi:hypothetical protein
MDWSDEDFFLCKQNETSSTTFKPPCAAGEFLCSKDGSCIPSRWACDRQADCHQAEDEDPEMCRGKMDCDAEHDFECADGECISVR